MEATACDHWGGGETSLNQSPSVDQRPEGPPPSVKSGVESPTRGPHPALLRGMEPPRLEEALLFLLLLYGFYSQIKGVLVSTA